MAQEGSIKTKGKTPKIIAVMVILAVLVGFAYAYMFNHYTTEELAKFALIRYLLR